MAQPRPLSTSNSDPSHKRTTSKPSTTNPPETHLTTLYLTNLRLLNLDLLPDWPRILTSHLLPATGHPTRTRLTAVEWSLYQLFRLYDAALTAEKLRPFFPPLEPVQSVNLRAALFRCLESLRKAGVLGREVVLRKSMLDECSGTRFWEVCLSFSAVVLAKVVREGRQRHGRPCVAERLGTVAVVGRGEREVLGGLVLAHKAGLGRVLRVREEKDDAFVRVDEVLEGKEAELEERRERLDGQEGDAKADRDLQLLEKGVEQSWIGNAELKHAILHGDEAVAGDEIMRQPFEQLWMSRNGNPGTDGQDAKIGLLEDLQARSNEQNMRLQRWQSYHQKLLDSKPAPETVPASTSPSKRFQHHRSLTLQTKQPSMTLPSPTSMTPRTASATQYDDILTQMREDLRKASTSRQSNKTTHSRPNLHQRSQTTQAISRKLSIPSDASQGASPEASSPRGTLQRSPSQPIRPGMGRRQSSRSKSWKQPRVISQKEPIPLKSEIFSPLKADRSSGMALPGGIDPTVSLSNAEASGEFVEASPVRSADFYHKDSESAPDSGISLGVTVPDEISPSECLSSPGSHLDSSPQPSLPTEDMPPRLTANNDFVFKTPALPPPRTASATASRPSLAERARMSMASSNTEDPTVTPDANHHSAFLPDPPASALAAVEHGNIIISPGTNGSVPASDRQNQIARKSSLADRTRASISLAPQHPHSHVRKSSSSRRSVFPVNQFDTPLKPQPQSSVLEPSPPSEPIEANGNNEAEEGQDHQSSPTAPAAVAAPMPTNGVGRTKKRDITPREQLFAPEAEYHSVFRSRPKIATSPVLSPAVEGRGEWMEGMGLDEE